MSLLSFVLPLLWAPSALALPDLEERLCAAILSGHPVYGRLQAHLLALPDVQDLLLLRGSRGHAFVVRGPESAQREVLKVLRMGLDATRMPYLRLTETSVRTNQPALEALLGPNQSPLGILMSRDTRIGLEISDALPNGAVVFIEIYESRSAMAIARTFFKDLVDRARAEGKRIVIIWSSEPGSARTATKTMRTIDLMQISGA